MQIGSPNLLVTVLRALFLSMCAAAIAAHLFRTQFIDAEGEKQSIPETVYDHPVLWFLLFLGCTQLITIADLFYRKKRIDSISAVCFGLMIGFLLSTLLVQAIEPIFRLFDRSEYYEQLVKVLVTLAAYYLGITLLLQTKDDFRFVIPYVEFAKEVKGQSPWILDSSALIDGRIADVVDTNIVDAPLVVPQFVLHEVQDVADSNDKIKRTRGRRGLEVLNKLQNNPKVEVSMYESGRDEMKGLSVDQKLVEVGKALDGQIVTNDFNLNKVATVQGIGVVNLNDLANALKPRYLPGERLRIKLIKEGETQGQGVGYLDDGTMVVCEQTVHLIGKDVDVIVTSVLQSSAGRMIFGRQVHSTNN
jgi:uncharacterized protein YacL